MKSTYLVCALGLGLASCGPDTSTATYGPPGNAVGPLPISVGMSVYAPEDCGYGLQGHQSYKVLALNGGMAKVEQEPYGSGRDFTAPAHCFTPSS